MKFLYSLLLCSFCLLSDAQIVLNGATLSGATIGTTNATSGGGGGCTPAYPSPAGTGLHVVDSNPDSLFSGFSAGAAFDGTFDNVDWMLNSPVAGKRWPINFTDNPQKITEWRFTFSGAPASSTAVWKWQGSNDGSSWVDITGTTFSFDTGSTVTTDTSLSSNTTQYSYYALLGVSGNADSGPYLQQAEPKLCH